MKRIIAIVLLCWSAGVMAVEPITGAFGVKLGDVWDGEATKTYEGDGYVRHIFIPESPLDAFGTYWVDVTPVKGLIFTIVASQFDEKCNIQYDVLKSALNKKYGVGESGVNGYEWTQGNRSIWLKCTPKLKLTYFDYAVYKSRIGELEPDTSNL